MTAIPAVLQLRMVFSGAPGIAPVTGAELAMCGEVEAVAAGLQDQRGCLLHSVGHAPMPGAGRPLAGLAELVLSASLQVHEEVASSMMAQLLDTSRQF